MEHAVSQPADQRRGEQHFVAARHSRQQRAGDAERKSDEQHAARAETVDRKARQRWQTPDTT